MSSATSSLPDSQQGTAAQFSAARFLEADRRWASVLVLLGCTKHSFDPSSCEAIVSTDFRRTEISRGRFRWVQFAVIAFRVSSETQNREDPELWYAMHTQRTPATVLPKATSTPRKSNAYARFVTDSLLQKVRTWSDVLQVLFFSVFCAVFESRKQVHPVGLEPTTFGSVVRRWAGRGSKSCAPPNADTARSSRFASGKNR